jgi:hypothetical protein
VHDAGVVDGMQAQYDLWQASKKRRKKIARLIAA